VFSNGGNTYSGTVNVTGGTVEAAHANALGSAAGINVSSGSTLELSGAGTYSGGPVNIVGDGVGGAGALLSTTTSKQVNSPIDVSGTTIGNSTGGTTFTINGPVNLTATADLTFAGAGDIVVNTGFGNGSLPVNTPGLVENVYDGTPNNAKIGSGMSSTPNATTIDPVINPLSYLAQTPDYTGVLLEEFTFNASQINNRAGGCCGSTDIGGVWTGKFVVDGTTVPVGDVSFGLRSDDGSTLHIDLNQNGTFEPSERIIDNGNFHGNTTRTGTATFTAAGDYDMAIGFFQGGGGHWVEAKFAPGTGIAYGSQTFIDPTKQSSFVYTAMPDNNVTKTDAGTTTFNGANTYNGTTSIEGGTLVAANNTALGSADGTAATGTTVADGATLALQGNIAIGDEHLTMGGAGATLRNLSGNNSMATQTVVVEDSSVPTDQVKIQSDSGSLVLGASGNFDLNYSQLNVDGAGDTTINQKISAQPIGSSAVTTQNALDAYAYDVSGNNGDQRLGDIGRGTAPPGPLSPSVDNALFNSAPISHILIDGTDRIDYRNDNDFRNGDAGLQAQGFAASLDGLPGLNQNDNFATAFYGQLNVPDLLGGGTPYNVEFGTNRSDDPTQIYVDLDQDGIFEHGQAAQRPVR